ncbi:subtilase family protein [Pontibacter mucosus]|uniref:Subtilase family protein n=1 Tax=Pontibacter mucosus TaxID=1649266 RepID=A0A2T5YDT5_9BACT|nr:S8 family serine peptidase [Pontibacter mucosus]PTX14709.1 subtilase family protein [Pontibacter mucosus]
MFVKFCLSVSIIIFTLLLSCNNVSKDSPDNVKVDTFPQPTSTSDSSVVAKKNEVAQPLEGDYILVYDDTLARRLAAIQIPGEKKSNPGYLDSLFTAEAKRIFEFQLLAEDPTLEIYNATAFCLFARSRLSYSGLVAKSKLYRNTGLRRVEDNYLFRVDIPESKSVAAPPTSEAQWGVLAVSNSSKPNGTYKAAWVLDTGIDPEHEDLNVDMVRSQSFVDGEALMDQNGHGTHIAGIIGAKANGTGVVGIAPNAPIRALKVISSDNQIILGDLIRALNYVLFNSISGEVMNLSFVRGFGPDIDVPIIQSIAARGVYVTIAAGNSSNMPSRSAENIDSYTYNGRTGVYPAAINGPRIYTVSAFGSPLHDAIFANYGPSVDFSMPGVNIISAEPLGQYSSRDGTSMAAPHLAGLLLLHNGSVHNSSKVLCSHDGNTYQVASEPKLD